MTNDRITNGLLLVGHGTRDRAGIEEFLALAERVRGLAGRRPVEACFLELAEPTIAAGMARLAEQGVRRITVVPLLLFAAGHAKCDIPRAVAAAVERFPDVEARQTPPLGCHERLLALSARRFEEAIAVLGAGLPTPPDQTLLLMVGRGSLDSEATDEMLRFARLRGQQTPIGRIETCFLAMQRPTLAEGLATAAAAGFRRIVVQPHLLFSGQLLQEVQHAVELAKAASQPTGDGPVCQEWIVTAALGPEAELAAAVIDLADAVVWEDNRPVR